MQCGSSAVVAGLCWLSAGLAARAKGGRADGGHALCDKPEPDPLQKT